MEILNVKIKNPKAKQLLRDLEAMDIIQIETKPNLNDLLKRLQKNKAILPNNDEIREEVEKVRQETFSSKR